MKKVKCEMLQNKSILGLSRVKTEKNKTIVRFLQTIAPVLGMYKRKRNLNVQNNIA